ncbi:MAG: L-glutamate gamma-semialdehyde dehydrogenase [Phycisphaerae bacterium]|nr:L-glutamate gamma-semialdehyde dehydrogenase [Phycisphaerae bacterium]
MLTTYRPEPYVNFAEPEPRQKMLDALKMVESQLGRSYPLRIGSQRIDTHSKIESYNPARTDQVIGYVAKADAEHARQAVAAAESAFKSWSRVDPDVRARYLLRAAAILRRRVYEFSAWMVYEESKSWIEAYADACECIDFLEFYGREMMRLGGAQPVTPFDGEENELRYIPLGVGAIIPPWNFPLAIMAGMTTAAIVTGNTVVLKPASTAPVIAAKFLEILCDECMLPPGVVNFCPGSGSEIGDTIVDHPRTRFIAFTGSREVGLRIFERAAKVQPGQVWLKRTILEMGGKDCIVVTDRADLDAAAEGVVAAAFGFQGQKCSACSRLIVDESVHDALLSKVTERTKKLTVGNPTTAENFSMGAVIDTAAYEKIISYIEIGEKEGTLVAGRRAAEYAKPKGAGAKSGISGLFIQPTIVTGIKPDARLAQEEIFGPVLAVIKGRGIDELLEIANGTEYGLTGAIYSNDRVHLERARHEFHVGNLYFNRKCTGALVDVQPFGGFNMSGTDSKAGGRDYLQLFMQGKSVTERL